GTASVSFTWSVTGLNSPPQVNPPAAQTSVAGSSASLGVSATDADGDPITFSASSLPAGLTIDSGGLISGTISLSAAAINTVTVTATDSHGAAGSASFIWKITPPPATDLSASAISSSQITLNWSDNSL